MNKRKVAIFVEGSTELIFVRNFLNAWYNYDTSLFAVDCYKLLSDQLNPVPYPLGSKESENYYQIVCVGNDNSVVSKMLSRAENLGRAGFAPIVGLRDMYCDLYREQSQQGRIVSVDLNEKMRRNAQEAIDSRNLPNRSDIHLHFAIMEIESWLLGMEKVTSEVVAHLALEEIKQESGWDLSQDPELSIYHPAVVLEKLLGLVGKSYGKHADDIESLTSQLMREDYEALYGSGRCQSFHDFVDTIIK